MASTARYSNVPPNKKKQSGCFEDTFGNDWKLANIETELTFFRRLMMISSAFVVGSRKSVPITAVKLRKIENRKVYQFNKDDFCGSRCLEKLSGCTEALKMGYLKEFIINISNNDEDHSDALEVYTLRFAYSRGITMKIVNGDGIPLHEEINFKGPEFVHDSTMILIRGLTRLLRVLSELPSDCFTTFRTSFYSNVPPNFKMNGWYDGKELYKFKEEPNEISLGDVHHKDVATRISVKTSYILAGVNIAEILETSTGHFDNSFASSDGTNLNETVDSTENVKAERTTEIRRRGIVAEPPMKVVIIDTSSSSSSNTGSTPPSDENVKSANGRVNSKKRPAPRDRKETVLKKKPKASKTLRLDKKTPGATRAASPV